MSVKFCEIYLCTLYGMLDLHTGAKNKSQSNAVITNEVQCILLKILGGSNFIRRSVYSQYCYFLGQ